MKMNTIIITIGILFIGVLNTVYILNIDSAIEPIELKEFNDVSELETWLLSNDVNNNTYITDIYDCENFAIDLVNDAIQDQHAIYSMGSGTAYVKTVIMYNTTDNTYYYGYEFIELNNHAYCITRINNIWYMIEPQNDVITELGIEF